jgi:hypothetical protein
LVDNKDQNQRGQGEGKQSEEALAALCKEKGREVKPMPLYGVLMASLFQAAPNQKQATSDSRGSGKGMNGKRRRRRKGRRSRGRRGGGGEAG